MKIMIPVAPLERAIAARGGLAAVVPHSEVEDPESGQMLASYSLEEKRIYIRTRDRLATARKAGGDIDLFIADDICCTVLNVHPSAVYGTDWFLFGVKDELAKITPSRVKLNADLVKEIRERAQAGEKVTHLAAEYGVKHNTIGDLIHYRTWRNVA